LLKRAKRRYLALEIDSQEPVSSQQFMDALWKQVTKLYGEYGASRTGLVLIDYEEGKRFAIVRVALQTLDVVRTALASITTIDSKPAAILVITASGTIKSLCKKIEK
jgi:RNase P/RNase MRP subunit POP5